MKNELNTEATVNETEIVSTEETTEERKPVDAEGLGILACAAAVVGLAGYGVYKLGQTIVRKCKAKKANAAANDQPKKDGFMKKLFGKKQANVESDSKEAEAKA